MTIKNIMKTQEAIKNIQHKEVFIFELLKILYDWDIPNHSRIASMQILTDKNLGFDLLKKYEVKSK